MGPDDNLQTMAVDQRVFYRLAIRLPVSYQLAAGSSGPTVCTGSTLNLSAGGMLLETPQPGAAVVDELLSGCSRLPLEMRLDGRELRVLAKVVWLEPTGPGDERCHLGLQFLDLSAQDQEHIWQFVLRNKAG